MLICMLLVVVLLISLVSLLSPSVRDNEHSNKTPVSGGNNSSGGNNLPGGNVGDIEEGEPVYETSCPYCDAVYDTREHSACPNEDCPSHEEDDETGDAPGSEFEKCPLCGIGILGEGSGECTNPDCTSNGGNVGLVVCPDCGQSYNADTEQSCPNTDCPSHSSTGEGWSYCPHCGAVVGEASDCPNGCDDLCPICSSSSYGLNGGVCLNCDGECSVCSDGYIQKSDGKCSNAACSSNSLGSDYNYGTCGTCGASLQEGGTCSNEECPTKQ